MDAIKTGKSKLTVEFIRDDHNCDLGKWIDGLPIDQGTDYAAIKKLHAEFHQEAARILEMALNGKKDQAIGAMAFFGKYSGISSDLVLALKKLERI